MTEAGTVVLGTGSPLMGDDGLGVLAVEMLRREWGDDPAVAFLDGGTWGMQVLPEIESAARLLLLDAIRAGDAPGALVRLEGEEIPRHLQLKLSPHQIDLGEVFALASLRGTFPPHAVALGIEPADVDLRDGLSPLVEAAVPALLRAAREQLEAWGHVSRVEEPAGRA